MEERRVREFDKSLIKLDQPHAEEFQAFDSIRFDLPFGEVPVSLRAHSWSPNAHAKLPASASLSLSLSLPAFFYSVRPVTSVRGISCFTLVLDFDRPVIDTEGEGGGRVVKRVWFPDDIGEIGAITEFSRARANRFSGLQILIRSAHIFLD